MAWVSLTASSPVSPLIDPYDFHRNCYLAAEEVVHTSVPLAHHVDAHVPF